MVDSPADLLANSLFWVFAALNNMWDFSRDYEAGKLDKDAVFEPSILGRLPDYSIAMAFGDVGSGAWYIPHVAYAVENNMMLGRSATAFDPAASASGSQAAVILARLAEAGLDDTPPPTPQRREFDR